MSVPPVAYTPRPDSTPEAELNTLCAVYKFVLDCHARRVNEVEAASAKAASNDAKGSVNDRAKASIHD